MNVPLILFIISWFVVGAVTTWYMHTRVMKENMYLGDLATYLLLTILGYALLIHAIYFCITERNPNKIIFKAKE